MLKDRVILISNVTHFAGMPTSKVLSDLGAAVVAHDESFTNDLVRSTFEADNTGVTAFAPQHPKTLAESVVKRFGRIDALVSNDIGVAKRAKIEDADVDDFRSVLEDMTVAPFSWPVL